jgi:hypothetical protein
MQRHYDAVRARGAEVVAVAQGTADEAVAFCRAAGVEYPCLGDPGRQSYRAFGLPRVGWRALLLDPEAIRAMREASRQGFRVSLRGSLMSHSDWFQLPGVAIVDRAGVVRYLHRSRHAGDQPAPAELVRVLDALTDKPARTQAPS